MSRTEPAGSSRTAGQGDVIAFLEDPATHGIAGPVRRIETHGAIVFLAGDTAYKMKRAVRFPFMDFSTLPLRREACRAELAVNAPHAPALYRDVVPVCRTDAGLALGPAGDAEPVEWVVRMARFDETRTLDLVAAQGPLDDGLLARLAAAIRASHDKAPRRDHDIGASLARYVGQNEEAFGERPDLFAPAEAAALTAATRLGLSACGELLRRRAAAGWVRRCHGDLHLRNVVLVDGKPVLFDAIEFDEDIATCDVFYDLAFMVMDLWERGQPAAANRLLCRYCWLAGDDELPGLAAMPLFLSVRAALRAKIEAAESALAGPDKRAAHEEAARRYFALARQALAGQSPRLVAVGGLSGTGKSTLAAALAARVGPPPGALHWRSDIERKRLMGVAETEHLPRHSYTQQASDAVYGRLLGRAAATLDAGLPTVVDAVFARSVEREAVAGVARERHAGFDGLWLEAPPAILRERVERRCDDASDADLAVVEGQARYDVGPVAWTRVDASGSRDAVLERASALLHLSEDQEPGKAEGKA